MNVIEKPDMAARAATAPAGDLDLDCFRLRRFHRGPRGGRRSRAPRCPGRSRRRCGHPRRQCEGRAFPRRRTRTPGTGRQCGARAAPALARSFGVAPERLAAEIARSARLAVRPQIVEVSRAQAPVQQVVETGEAADLTALPVHLQHGLDGAPYISASIDYALDHRTGWTNVGIRRLMLRGRHEAGVDLVAPSDLRAIYEASAVASGRPLPVSFVVGVQPDRPCRRDDAHAGRRTRHRRVAARCAARRRVVKGVTNDIRVPTADAEMVLEGYFDARAAMSSPKGPMASSSSYYGAVKKNPVFHPHRHTTRRRDATVPDRDHRRARHEPHRHRAAVLTARAAHRGGDLAGARDRRARAGFAVHATHLERRGNFNVRESSAAPARARRSAQRHRRVPVRTPGQRQERVRWSIPTSTSPPTSRWTGQWRPASSRTAT